MSYEGLRCSYTTRMAWRELNRWLLVWTPFSATHGIPGKPTHRDPTPSKTSSAHIPSTRPNPSINHKPQTKRTTYARAKLNWVISRYQTVTHEDNSRLVTDIKRISHLSKPAAAASFKEQATPPTSLLNRLSNNKNEKKTQLQTEGTTQTPSNSSQNPASPFSK